MIPKGLINLGKGLVALLLIGVFALFLVGIPAEEVPTTVDEPAPLVLVEPTHLVKDGNRTYNYTVWSVVIEGNKYYIRTDELGTGNIHIEFSTNDPKHRPEVFLEMDVVCKLSNNSRCAKIEILGLDAIARSLRIKE